MTVCRLAVLTVLLGLAASSSGWTDEEAVPGISEDQFRRIAAVFLENPTSEEGLKLAKIVVVYGIQTPDALIFYGKEEATWMGDGSDLEQEQKLVLHAGYVAGNVLSQLHSGVKQNDRYSGLLTLFQVYRKLQAEEEEFKLEAVEELLQKQKEGQLLGYLVELEKEKPTRLTPEIEEQLRKNREKMEEELKKKKNNSV